MGDVWSQLGKTTKALQSYEMALEISKKLARDDPDNSNVQRDLWVSYGKIGDVQQQLGNTQGALQSYEMALEISKKLARDDPDNSNAQRD